MERIFWKTAANFADHSARRSRHVSGVIAIASKNSQFCHRHIIPFPPMEHGPHSVISSS
jgi:hypothetical protein